MTLLSKYIKDKSFDIRMVQRGLTKGLILQEEVDKHLKTVRDDTENADYTTLDSLAEKKDV